MTLKLNCVLVVASWSLVDISGMPAGMAADRNDLSTNNCYVHAFAREQFRSPVTTYTGPTQEPAFWQQARSLMVGPQAHLIGYADRGYKEQTLALPPGMHVADLAAIDFHARVRSFKVICGDSDPQLAPGVL